MGTQPRSQGHFTKETEKTRLLGELYVKAGCVLTLSVGPENTTGDLLSKRNLVPKVLSLPS